MKYVEQRIELDATEFNANLHKIIEAKQKQKESHDFINKRITDNLGKVEVDTKMNSNHESVETKGSEDYKGTYEKKFIDLAREYSNVDVFSKCAWERMRELSDDEDDE